jgi:flavin reductase (DIM6/NTAB) family NADH-FMN oxidoreductase RutF
MADTYYYEPSKGHGLAHDPFNSIVAPRPIGWVSSLDRDGRRNLAPYSFFNAFNYRPPLIGFSSNGWKDSIANLEATGEFCWNLATRELAGAMNASSATVPHDVDEFALAGLTAVQGTVVKAPRVAESPVNFECRVTQTLRLQTKEGREVDTWLVLGEVVAVHIDRSLIDNGVYNTTRARPVVRGGGQADYFEITDAAKFLMERPA